MNDIEKIIDEVKNQGVLAAFGDGVSIQGKDFKVLYQNSIHKELNGDSIGEYCYRSYAKSNVVCDECPLQKAFEDHGVHRAAKTKHSGSGNKYVEMTASPLKDPAGNIIAGIAVIRDITLSIRTENQLQASSRVLTLANRHTNMDSLLEDFVSEVKDLTGCGAVGVRILDNEGNIPYEVQDGFPQSFYELESPLSIKTDNCMCINVIKGEADGNLPFILQAGRFI